MRQLKPAPAVVALLLLAVGCGGSADKKTSAPVVTRPAAGLPTATTAVSVPASADKSQPYWVPVTSFSGTSSMKTSPFAIEPGALQWKATWHCDGSPFAIDGAKESGEPLKRQVAESATCPADGTGYSADTGSLVLEVTAKGPWKVDIEQQLDAPLIEPPPAGLENAQLIGTAPIHDVDRPGHGTARIFQFPDGNRLIRLEDFYVSPNIELELRLSELPDATNTPDVAAAPYGQIGFLKATVGSMNYSVPPEVDLAKYRSVVIWCEITRNVYAGGPIQT